MRDRENTDSQADISFGRLRRGMCFALLLLGALPSPGRPQESPASAMSPAHAFTIGDGAFRLDGRPIQIISGELHFARIPREYWRHRLRMAKAMGLNTIATYVFWNYHETTPGTFDFRTGNRNLAKCKRAHQL